MGADNRKSPQTYPVRTAGAIRYFPVTRRGKVIGYLWAGVDDDAAGFRATSGDNLDRLGAYAAWDERLRQSYAAGITPLEALRQWVGVPEDSRGGGIAPGAEEKEASSETAMIRELIDPDYVQRSEEELEKLGFAGDMEYYSYLNVAGGTGGEAPGSYPFLTDAAVRYLPVLKNGVPYGYLWASVDDRAAGYYSRAEVADQATDTYQAWIARLDHAKAGGFSPLRALRQWVGAPEDPVAGTIPSDAAEKELPGLRALEELAGIA